MKWLRLWIGDECGQSSWEYRYLLRWLSSNSIADDRLLESAPLTLPECRWTQALKRWEHDARASEAGQQLVPFAA